MVRDAYSKVEETTHRSFLGRDLFFFPVKEEQLILDADVAGELLVQGWIFLQKTRKLTIGQGILHVLQKISKLSEAFNPPNI